MPTLKVLIGDKVVDAEIVVHNGALFAKVPEEYIDSSMPLLTAKLQAQTEAVGMLLSAGDMVRAAEARFEDFYGEPGVERAKMLAQEYHRCRELYEAGKFDLAKEKLTALRGQVGQEMISLELKNMVKAELPTKAKQEKGTEKVKVTRGKKKEVTYQMAARFDAAKLMAKLFGADPKEPVGELLNLPNPSFPIDLMQISSSCSCDCALPGLPPGTSYVGWLLVQRRFSDNVLICQDQTSYGSATSIIRVTSCSSDEGPSTYCEKIREWYLPEQS